MQKYARFVAAVVMLIAGAGCAAVPGEIGQATPTIPSIETIVKETMQASSAAVAPTSPAPGDLPTETSEPIPVQQSGRIEAVVQAQGVNLRTGPGTIFPPRKLLDNNTRLTVLGRSRGDDWLLVQADGVEGWITASFVFIENDAGVAVLPVQNPGEAITVRGQVVDTFGGPVPGITFAIIQGAGVNEQRTDATTRKDGFFYAYLPIDASGDWRVALTGIDCKSPIVDKDCGFTGRFVPTYKDITIPQSEPLTFQYVTQ